MTTSPNTHEEKPSLEGFQGQVPYDRLKQQLDEVQLENGRYKQRLEKLAIVVLEREKKITELQQYEERFRNGSEKRQSADAEQERIRQKLKEVGAEKERIAKELEESNQHVSQLELVIRTLRERQKGKELETTQFQGEFQKAKKTLRELEDQVKANEQKIQKLEEEIEREQLAKQDALEEVSALYTQFEALKSLLADSNARDELSSKEILRANAAIETLTNELSISQRDAVYQQKEFEEKLAQHQRELEKGERRFQEVLAEKKQLQEDMEKLKSAKDEAEARLKMAQQHLAKKVKETSDLHDKAHTKDALIQELERHLDQSNALLENQKKAFDSEINQEKRLQETLLETSRSAEAMAAKWEEKYFSLYERWQEQELRLKEVKKIEERHVQLQALLANIGGYFGTSAHPSELNPLQPPSLAPRNSESLTAGGAIGFQKAMQAHEASFSIATPAHEPMMEENSNLIETHEMKRPYQNLFDMPNQTGRSKFDLFE